MRFFNLLLVLFFCALLVCSANATDSTQELVVDFYKHLFGELGRHHGSIEETLTPEVREQFAQLEKQVGIPLGTSLAAVVELRIMDLELSLRHTHRLLEAVQQLAAR